MADEEKKKVDKELKPDEDTEVKETPGKIDPSKFVDKEAMAEIQRQNAELAERVNKLSGVTKKLDDVRTAITGEESEKIDSEKFFKEFAEDPQKALDGYYDKRSKSELEPIKKKIEERELDDRKRDMAEQDRVAFARLQAQDPNYLNVMKNVGDYVGKEELAELLKYPNRTEVIYSLVKSRMGAGEVAKKMEEKQATNQAKDDANKTAVTEEPSGGKIETETDKEKRRKEINEGIAKGDWNSEEIRRKSFDEFWETVQGVKK